MQEKLDLLKKAQEFENAFYSSYRCQREDESPLTKPSRDKRRKKNRIKNKMAKKQRRKNKRK